jgi:Leucine-rich repeat (LRR) protein
VISAFAFQSLSSLVILNLGRNKPKEIDETGFHSLNNLEDMYLEDNDLNKVPTDSMYKVINLKKKKSTERNP